MVRKLVTRKRQVVATTQEPMTLTNYTGVKKFLARKPEWDDLLINSGLFKFRGSSDPAWADWTVESKTFRILKFAKNDEIFFSIQVPHTYVEGTNIRAHVHWTPHDRGTSEKDKTVGWKLDYTWANPGCETFASAGTLDLSGSCTGTNNFHELAGADTPIEIDGTGKKISSMLICRLFRSDTGTDDTWAGTGADNPALLQFDFHHQVSSMGSKEEWVK